MKQKFLFVLIITILFVLTLTACSKPTPTATNQPAASAALDGKTILETKCTACHSLDRVTSKKGTLSQWQSVVDRMVQNGAQLSADEKTTLTQYLADTYK
jgi:cytochrome c5